MPAKPKPKPAANGRIVTPERMSAVWHSHPKLTLATLGVVITILTSVAPFLSAWYADFVHRSEFNDYKFDAMRRDAWRDVRAFGIEATLIRNRVNDCNLMKQRASGKALSPLERAVCDQYEAELTEANRKFVESKTLANALSEGKNK